MRPLTIALLWVLPMACTGSSRAPTGGGTAPPTTPLTMIVDTGASANAELSGQVEVVALERVDGSVTANVLAQPAAMVLADPAGRSSGIELTGAPAGVYQAAQIMLTPGSLTATVPGGAAQPVTGVPTPVRIPFDQLLQVPSADEGFVARHVDEVVLSPGPNGVLQWDPIIDGRLRDLLPMFDLRMTIAEIDTAALRAVAWVPNWNGARVTLRFQAAARLELGGQVVSTAEFINHLEHGMEIAVDGLVDGARLLWVLAASDDVPRPPVASGNKSEVLGAITELDPANPAFTLRVLRVRKAAAAFAAGVPAELVVLVSGKTNVKWNPRWGGGGAQVGYSALHVGQQAWVEWHGAAPNGVVTAHKVDITAGGPGRHHAAIAGRVQVVKTSANEIVVASANGAGFTIGKQTHPFVTVEVEPATFVVRREGARGVFLIAQSEIVSGEAIFVLGRPEGGEPRLRATLVVVGGP